MNSFWDERWLMIQVRQESCSIMDAVQFAQEDRVNPKKITISAKSNFLLLMKLSTTLKILYIVEVKMCIYSPYERQFMENHRLQFYSQRRRGSSNSHVHHPPT
jgi:hypothetical protein